MRLLVAGAVATDGDCRRGAARPAAEAVGQGLPRLHDAAEQVEALRDQDVRVVGHGRAELCVGLGLRGRGELLLLGDTGVGHLGLELVEPVLRGVVVLDEGGRHGDDLHTVADGILQLLLDLHGVARDLRRRGNFTAVNHLGQGVVGREDPGQRRGDVVAHQGVVHPVEVLVVLLEPVGLAGDDPPGHDGRHAAGRLTGHAHVHARVTLVLVHLHGCVEHVDLSPRCLEVQSAGKRLTTRLAEHGDHSDRLRSDDRERGEQHEDEPESQRDVHRAAPRQTHVHSVATTVRTVALFVRRLGGATGFLRLVQPQDGRDQRNDEQGQGSKEPEAHGALLLVGPL